MISVFPSCHSNTKLGAAPVSTRNYCSSLFEGKKKNSFNCQETTGRTSVGDGRHLLAKCQPHPPTHTDTHPPSHTPTQTRTHTHIHTHTHPPTQTPTQTRTHYHITCKKWKCSPTTNRTKDTTVSPILISPCLSGANLQVKSQSLFTLGVRCSPFCGRK